MIKEIRYVASLCYYDGVQIFEGESGRFSFVAIHVNDTEDLYFVIQVSMKNLSIFKDGKMDLISLIRKRIRMKWYIARVYDYFEPIKLSLGSGVIPDRYMPDKGFRLNK